MNRNTVVAIFTFWLFLSWYIVHVFSTRGQLISSNEETQHLHTLEASFFSKEVFNDIRATILASKLSTNGADEILMASKTKATGTILSFNKAGEMDLRARTGDEVDYQALYKFLDAVRVDGTNAWVLQVLRANGLDSEKIHDIAPLHLDDSLVTKDHGKVTSLRNPLAFMTYAQLVPYETTVLYLSVPTDMEAGRFVIDSNMRDFHQIGDSEESVSLPVLYDKPHDDIVIQPEENLLVRFRGDVPHHVEGFRSSLKGDAGVRLSLVVEQYKLPHRYLRMVKPFFTTAKFLS